MKLTVRAVEPKDVQSLYRLLQAKAEFDGALQSLKATEETLRLELFSTTPRFRAVVAETNNEIIGMATYFQTFSSFLMKPSLWMDDLYVKEAYRKNGVGQELIQCLCRFASDLGCGRIEWVVAAGNDNGRNFYEKMGAAIVETVRLARLSESAIQLHVPPAAFQETPAK